MFNIIQMFVLKTHDCIYINCKHRMTLAMHGNIEIHLESHENQTANQLNHFVMNRQMKDHTYSYRFPQYYCNSLAEIIYFCDPLNYHDGFTVCPLDFQLAMRNQSRIEQDCQKQTTEFLHNAENTGQVNRLTTAVH